MELYKNESKGGTTPSVSIQVNADTSDAEKKLDALIEKMMCLHESLSVVISNIDEAIEKAERFSEFPAQNDAYTYGSGFSDGAVVFCPDCGHAVQSGYSAFISQADADQYARERCPICTAKNTAEANRQRENELAMRVALVRELESVVRKAEPTVRSIEHQRPGKDGECLIIHYSGTETRVPIGGDSLLAIAKSVMEALPY